MKVIDTKVKEEFETPCADVVLFDTEDVIRTSPPGINTEKEEF